MFDMFSINSSLKITLLFLFLLFSGISSGDKVKGDASSDTIFVACTPGDPLIKSLLNIPAETKVDFIRWHLTLTNAGSEINHFMLNIGFGESKPNTQDFKEGGDKLSFEGEYSVFQAVNWELKGTIYQFKSNNNPGISFSIVKLNENLFQLLTPDHHLMVGNGGWSYTLNRKEPVIPASGDLPSLTLASTLINDTVLQVIFDGRTPCREFAKEYNLSIADGCFKMKWSLTLNRDPKTFLPTTYQINRTNSRGNLIQGKWTVIKGTSSNSGLVIYQLDPDKPEKSLSFLAGDKNVLFFLTRTRELFTGNEEFSFTLNRRKKVENL